MFVNVCARGKYREIILKLYNSESWDKPKKNSRNASTQVNKSCDFVNINEQKNGLMKKINRNFFVNHVKNPPKKKWKFKRSNSTRKLAFNYLNSSMWFIWH